MKILSIASTSKYKIQQKLSTKESAKQKKVLENRKYIGR
jgi:hypothetical protein